MKYLVAVILFSFCMAAQTPTFALLYASMSPCRGLTGVRLPLFDDGAHKCPLLVPATAFDRTNNTVTLPSGAGIIFISNLTPAGSINGVNASFRLTPAPSNNEFLQLFRNGVLQKPQVDFVISGETVTFVPGAIPQTGDILTAFYRVIQ